MSAEVKTELEEMSGQVLELARCLAGRDLDADARPSLTKLALLQSVSHSYQVRVQRNSDDLCSWRSQNSTSVVSSSSWEI